MPERFDFTPTVFTFNQFVLADWSQRRSCGSSLTQLTSTSMSPSLSKSPNAQPLPDTFSRIPGPAVPETSANLPLPRFRVSFANLRIDMTIADEDVGPSIVVEIQEAHAPAEEPRVLT